MRYTTRIIVPPKVRRSGQPGAGGAYRPQVIGVRKTFGFDDPFGVATPGHLAAAAMHPEVAPMFVQHSFANGGMGPRPPAETMASAVRAVGLARFRPPWGADADLLRNPQEVEDAAAAGFTYFTLDPTEFLRSGVEWLGETDLVAELDALIGEGTLTEDWCQPYLDRTINLYGDQQLTLTLDPLRRAAVKYGRAIRHCARLSEAVARASHGRPYETEAYFGGGSSVIAALEHLFVGLELEARGVRLTSLALPLVGPEDAASLRAGSAGAVETRLREHAAVAEFCGPYKLSFHHVSLLPSLYPLLASCCRDALHVKSAHLSFLEAMKVVYHTDLQLFTRISEAVTTCAHDQSEEFADHFSRTVIEDAETDSSGGKLFEDLLAKSAWMLTTEADPDGKPWRALILEILDRHADIYREQLTSLFDKRLLLLKVG